MAGFFFLSSECCILFVWHTHILHNKQIKKRGRLQLLQCRKYTIYWDHDTTLLLFGCLFIHYCENHYYKHQVSDVWMFGQFNRESKYETYTVYLKFKIQGPDGFELSWEQQNKCADTIHWRIIWKNNRLYQGVSFLKLLLFSPVTSQEIEWQKNRVIFGIS